MTLQDDIALASAIIRYIEAIQNLLSILGRGNVNTRDIWRKIRSSLEQVHENRTDGSNPRLVEMARECHSISRLLKATDPSKKSWNIPAHRDHFDSKDRKILTAELNTLRENVAVELQTQIRNEQHALYHLSRETDEVVESSTSPNWRARVDDLENRVNDIEHSPDSANEQELLTTLVEQLNLSREIKELSALRVYKTVTVVPLMWAEAIAPYLSRNKLIKSREELAEIEQELLDLSEVFRTRFHFRVNDIYRITDDEKEAEVKLHKYIQKIVDKHGKEGSLLIIVYGGHGVDTSSVEHWKNEANNCIWVPNTSEKCAIVNWTDVQKRLEYAAADCLMILDCCHAGNTISRSRARTINEILAASTRESPSYSGARAYSKLLTHKLDTMSLPFTVEALHKSMLSASRPNQPNLPGGALDATPDHGFTWRSLERSILLQALPSEPSPPVTDEPSVETVATDGSTRPRMFIELELDYSQDIKATVAEWQRWFTAQRPPPSFRGVHFRTLEDIYAKWIKKKK